MDDDAIHSCDDDGAEMRPDLLAKPGLCVCCAKDDEPSEGPLCALIRLDQEGEGEFRCEGYERRGS